MEIAERFPDAVHDAVHEIDDGDGNASALTARLLPAARSEMQAVLARVTR